MYKIVEIESSGNIQEKLAKLEFALGNMLVEKYVSADEKEIIFECKKYFLRTGTYISGNIIVKISSQIVTVYISSAGGGRGMLNITFGVNEKFVDMLLQYVHEYI